MMVIKKYVDRVFGQISIVDPDKRVHYTHPYLGTKRGTIASSLLKRIDISDTEKGLS
jgi:hypothetical protein